MNGKGIYIYKKKNSFENKQTNTLYSKSESEFGDLFRLYQIFTTSTGLELPTDLNTKFEKEPENWQLYYETKHASLKASDREVLIQQANKEFKDAQKYLKTFQDDVNYSLLIQVASNMLWILGKTLEKKCISFYLHCYFFRCVTRVCRLLLYLELHVTHGESTSRCTRNIRYGS